MTLPRLRKPRSEGRGQGSGEPHPEGSPESHRRDPTRPHRAAARRVSSTVGSQAGSGVKGRAGVQSEGCQPLAWCHHACCNPEAVMMADNETDTPNTQGNSSLRHFWGARDDANSAERWTSYKVGTLTPEIAGASCADHTSFASHVVSPRSRPVYSVSRVILACHLGCPQIAPGASMCLGNGAVLRCCLPFCG